VTGPLYVGIDGGGTRARAVALDTAGHVRARREGPAGIVTPADVCAAADAAAALTRAVLADAGVDAAAGGRAAALCCGLAGAGRVREREAVRVALLLTGVADTVLVTGDAEAAMHDAFDVAPGVLLVAGTGSIAWARAHDGAVARAGGWGHLLGDEGSGYAIGLAALRAVARAADARSAATALTAAVLMAAGVAAPADLVRFAAAAAKRDIAALAPTVLGCASAGDATAAGIRDDAAAELVDLATAAARRARLAAPDVALTGGLIAPGGPLRDAVAAGLRQAIAARVSETPVDAARGAALLALQAAGGGAG
jgi:N-acetylglucosamine kinase-like BadF-type ATPase